MEFKEITLDFFTFGGFLDALRINKYQQIPLLVSRHNLRSDENTHQQGLSEFMFWTILSSSKLPHNTHPITRLDVWSMKTVLRESGFPRSIHKSTGMPRKKEI